MKQNAWVIYGMCGRVLVEAIHDAVSIETLLPTELTKEDAIKLRDALNSAIEIVFPEKADTDTADEGR